MGVRKDIEQELFPDSIFTGSSEIYFEISRILHGGIEVTFPEVILESEWGTKLDRARTAAREAIIASAATEACYADFSAGNNDYLIRGAENVRMRRAGQNHAEVVNNNEVEQ
jgi:hypothetical protein